MYDFSRALKATLPDLFQKYVFDNGISINRGEIIDIGLISKNEYLENLKDAKLYEIYTLCKQYIKLSIISFLIFGLLGIATVYL